MRSVIVVGGIFSSFEYFKPGFGLLNRQRQYGNITKAFGELEVNVDFHLVELRIGFFDSAAFMNTDPELPSKFKV